MSVRVQHRRQWLASGGGEAVAVLRGDARWWCRFRADSPETWNELVDRVTADLDGDLLCTVGGAASEAVTALRAGGFVASRVEQVWRVPLAAEGAAPGRIVSRSHPAPRVHRYRHELVSVSDCDLAEVARLDGVIRADIPGTQEWVSSASDIAATLRDEEFDPALYLVARHRETGSLDGLIRVWNRRPEPRLGCLGVTRPWRRTRLAAQLVAAVRRELSGRGVSAIVTETDTTNRDAATMARRAGGSITGGTTEWLRPAATGVATAWHREG